MANYLAELLRRAGLLQGRSGSGDAPAPDPAPVPAATDDDDDDDGLEDISLRMTRLVSLEELLDEHLQPEAADAERSLAHRAGLEVTRAEIYAAAGLDDAPWSIDGAVAFVAERRGDTEPGQLADALFEALVAAKIRPESVLTDAVLRDKALDLYEAGIIAEVDDLVAEADAHAARLADRIAQLQEQVAEATAERERLLADLASWKANKRATEEEWASVIDLLFKGAGASLVGGRTLAEDEG